MKILMSLRRVLRWKVGKSAYKVNKKRETGKVSKWKDGKNEKKVKEKNAVNEN